MIDRVNDIKDWSEKDYYDSTIDIIVEALYNIKNEKLAIDILDHINDPDTTICNQREEVIISKDLYSKLSEKYPEEFV